MPLATRVEATAHQHQAPGRKQSRELAEKVSLHGVFMDVLGVGVLITGDSGAGKSELGLELISRGHGLVADDVVLSMLPQFHVAAWNCQPLLAWWVGATVVLERSFQPRRVLQLLAERGVTAMMGVPTQ